MRVVLIRHSKTAGNLKGRYIGTTDEPLCEEGIRLLEGKTYPTAELVYVSPMKRCRETASLIYPTLTQREEPLLRECDFGDFENKNYLAPMEIRTIRPGWTAEEPCLFREERAGRLFRNAAGRAF